MGDLTLSQPDQTAHALVNRSVVNRRYEYRVPGLGRYARESAVPHFGFNASG